MSIQWHTFEDAPFEEVLSLQREAASDVAAGGSERVFIGTHRPVITFGKRGSESDLTVDIGAIRASGIDIVRTDRGGLLTYHGPGQLVTYPIIDLKRRSLGVKRFVTLLEQAMIDTLLHFGVRAGRRDGHTGVFVDKFKIGSIGIHVSRGVTTHGSALNISTNMDHFRYLNPCGLSASDMTSLEIISGKSPSMQEVVQVYKDVFSGLLKESGFYRREHV